MSDLYCPYCDDNLGNHVDDCHEPDEEYEHQCPKCEKNFIFTIDYYPSFSSNKADCLNGGEHDYRVITGFPREYFINKRRCHMCSKEITVTAIGNFIELERKNG